MRLFVAVDVPQALKDAIELSVVDPLREALPGARWTRPHGRHLTLKFLGEVLDERVPVLEEALAAAASRHGPFEAAFEAVGGFPNLRRPRVLWVGVGEGAEAMSALASSVDEALSVVSFERESRPFSGHLTLARFGVPRPVGELPTVTVPPDRFEVAEVVLFRSQLHPQGARYTALSRSSLTG